MTRRKDDDEIILQAGAAGRPIRDMAQARGMTEAAVKAVIDREAEDQLGGMQLRRELLFEMLRLRSLGRKFYERAMDGDGDKDAGILYIKASERLATLLGMNAPLGHGVQVIHQTTPVRQLNSTEETRAILDHVLRITVRERELLYRCELDGDNSPEVLAEINGLRAARGRGPRSEDERP